MQSKLEREVRFLKIYAFIATLVSAAFFLSGFANQKFTEIDVERINIVEKDGKLRMVISNQERQHPGIVNGKTIPRTGPRAPGMLFFNHIGDEMGGLAFGENGKASHFGSFTFDKFRGDQTIGFRYLESDNGAIHQGVEMWKQPSSITGDVVGDNYRALDKIKDPKERAAAAQAMVEKGEITTSLLFLGKRRDNTTGLHLYDEKGKPRVRLQVGADGTPKLEFLDAAGKVTMTLPEAPKAVEKKVE